MTGITVNDTVYLFIWLYICLFISLAARVDHGHHAGKAVRAINDAVAMAKAVAKAVRMISKGRLT